MVQVEGSGTTRAEGQVIPKKRGDAKTLIEVCSSVLGSHEEQTEKLTGLLQIQSGQYIAVATRRSNNKALDAGRELGNLDRDLIERRYNIRC